MRAQIDLIRHGEPVGGRRYRGHGADDPLSDKGWDQMRRAVAGRNDWEWVVTSPLSRCLAFAQELADQRDLPLEVEKDFREIGFGAWEGRTPDELMSEDATAWQAFYLDPIANRPEGAEIAEDFIQRVARAFDRTAEKANGRRTLIVCHAGVIRAVVAHVLQAEPGRMFRIKVPNARITRIRCDTLGYSLEAVNV